MLGTGEENIQFLLVYAASILLIDIGDVVYNTQHGIGFWVLKSIVQDFFYYNCVWCL